MKKLLALFLLIFLTGGLASCTGKNCNHRDADDNSICDTCGVSYTDGMDVICNHRDADDNSTCDTCGVSYTDGTDVTCNHRDTDENGICDSCQEDINPSEPNDSESPSVSCGMHLDKTPADAICDKCGEIVEVGGVLVCGVTEYFPLNYFEAGMWVGFETELAIEVGKVLGMGVEFREIDWSMKYNELNAGNISCIWNGFAASAERTDLVDCTYGYLMLRHCIVVRSDRQAELRDAASLLGKKAAVEAGSWGTLYAKEELSPCSILEYAVETDALLSVFRGDADYAIVDYSFAMETCATGTFASLFVIDDIITDGDIIVVGCKKGSDLDAMINTALEVLHKNGKILELAKKYGLEHSLAWIEKYS